MRNIIIVLMVVSGILLMAAFLSMQSPEAVCEEKKVSSDGSSYEECVRMSERTMYE